jgi:hypothetical protein
MHPARTWPRAAIADLLSEPIIRIRQSELTVEHAEMTGIYDAQWDEVEVKS